MPCCLVLAAPLQVEDRVTAQEALDIATGKSAKRRQTAAKKARKAAAAAGGGSAELVQSR